jgi:Homeodomain-like domain
VAGASAKPALLRENEREELVGCRRSSSVRAGLAARAQIVPLAADGTPNVEIARLVGVSRPTVNLWRSRYVERGLARLADEQRSGRKRSNDQRRIMAETTNASPRARPAASAWRPRSWPGPPSASSPSLSQLSRLGRSESGSWPMFIDCGHRGELVPGLFRRLPPRLGSREPGRYTAPHGRSISPGGHERDRPYGGVQRRRPRHRRDPELLVRLWCVGLRGTTTQNLRM